jgi:HEAT repeat protein
MGTLPQTPVRAEARAAAAWALGLLHEGTPVAEIIPSLEERLKDEATPLIGGDDRRIRRMCAVTLGRMKAKQALGTLRKFYVAGKPSLDAVNNACGWALEQLTGERMPPAGTVEVFPGGWFLNSLETTSSAAGK